MIWMTFPKDLLHRIDSRVFLIVAFLLPLAVRFLPELIMGSFIVGFDTVSYYVPITLKVVSGGVGFLEFFAIAPVLYYLLAGLTFVGVPLSLSLKSIPPLLHGFLGLAIFLYARTALAWNQRKSLLVSCLATLYFVSLRISWDMLRSELALVFLFLLLIVVRRCSDRVSLRNGALLLFLTSIVVLSNQLVAVLMLLIFLVLVVKEFSLNKVAVGLRLAVCSLPAVVLFALSTYSVFIVSSGVVSDEWASLFGLTSGYGMAVGTLGFLLYCSLPIIPVVLLGLKRFKNLEMIVWMGWCLIGAFLPIFSGFPLFPLGYRWILLMVFPLSFVAIEGIKQFNRLKLRAVLVGILILLSASFVVLPAEAALPFFVAFPNYVPSSMLQNGVPQRDCADVVKVMEWTKANMKANDVLLVHDAFHGWALLYSDKTRVVSYGYGDPAAAAVEIHADCSDRIYVVWWVAGKGWHGLASLPTSFTEVYRSNEIAAYVYEAT